jgi:uncharacterized protein (TIGR03546 family)
MFRGLVASAHQLQSEATQHRSPGKIAIGLAMGMSLGLIPLDNLVWFMLLMGVLFLPVHQVAAVSAWVVTSLFSSQLSVVPHALGDWLLSMDGVRGCVRQAQVIPAGAWFRLNNTLVVGSLALGLVSLLPSWVVLLVLGGKSQQRTSPGVDDFSQVATVYRKSSPSIARVTIERELPASQVPFADTTLAENIAVAPAVSLRVDSAHPDLSSVSNEHDTEANSITIRETFIEVIRLRAPQPPHFSSTNDRKEAMFVETENSIASISASASETVSQEEPSGTQVNDAVLTRYSPAHQQLSGPKSSNSLRFLLRHLTSHRNAAEGPESQA